MFISGLLDLTDNRGGRRHRAARGRCATTGTTPYLVVAADKGTASFSDIANGVAQSYGFWLGDAFASGGSAGYDHKAMGITARGAGNRSSGTSARWAIDTQTEDFTVVGVGDMSGDVFGNGMLLSSTSACWPPSTTAHLPRPQPGRCRVDAEARALRPAAIVLGRLRRADLRGWWRLRAVAQGDPRLGRDDRRTGPRRTARRALTPAELMKAILLAPADLLWNGGIGTYVKASTEDNLSVGDRANDAIRVNGGARVKVVGGGNLGCTQLGRIEPLPRRSDQHRRHRQLGGVDTSDHEVNIKILWSAVVRSGGLDPRERNDLLRVDDRRGRRRLWDNYMSRTSCSATPAPRSTRWPPCTSA